MSDGHPRVGGIGLHTPADVHYGLAGAKTADRAKILAEARANHPYRFSSQQPPQLLDFIHAHNEDRDVLEAKARAGVISIGQGAGGRTP